MAIDVGGSTSDFVVVPATLAGGMIESHHASLKLAGDVLRRVLDRLGALDGGPDGADPDACAGFIKLCREMGIAGSIDQFEEGLRSPVFRSRTVDLFLREVMGNQRMSAEFANYLRTHRQSGRKAVGSVAFLYATLAYYLGLLADPFIPNMIYNVHIAGRGSLLLSWLPGGFKDLPQHFFQAGLSAARAMLSWELSGNEFVKREVAFGVLGYDPEMVATSKKTRAVFGEGGFTSVDSTEVGWREPVTADLLRRLPARVPVTEDGKLALPLLERFVTTWAEFTSESDVKNALKIRPEILADVKFRSRLQSALFGPTSSWKRAALAANNDDAPAIECEPLLITELKALLEYALSPANPVNIF